MNSLSLRERGEGRGEGQTRAQRTLMLGLFLTALTSLTACGEREPGLSVSVTAEVASPLSFDTATLSIERVELVRCETARPWWRALSPISTAWAHGGADVEATDPRVVVAPVLVALTSAESQPIATFAPPPGAVCGVSLTFAPSTAEARAQGTTLFLEGAGVRQLSTRRYVVTKSFDARALDEAHPALTLRLRFEAAPLGADGDQTLAALLATVSVVADERT